MLSRIVDNISYCNLNNKDMIREIIVKIGLKRINTQEEIITEVLLDSGATELVMSSEFAKKNKSSN